MTKVTRRTVLAGASAVAGASIVGRRARAAEFNLKYGNDLPATHPINKRASEACDAIRAATNGRLDIQIFPNSQLGGSTDMLSQVRSGALDIFTVGSPLANLVPVSSISSIAFAFTDFDRVWAAVDGDLGAHIRQQIGTIGLVAFDKMWDNGFRQITTSNKPINAPDDLKGLKLRVPVSPLFTSMFRALGTSPTAINFVEVYTALQTRIVDGQENPLALIDAAKFYEVQKYCSLTGHMWEGFWMVANRKTWEQLPADVRETAARLLNDGAVKQREDMTKLNATLETQLKEKGLTFNTVDKKPFQQALKTAGFYSEWRQKYGEDAWKILERYSGNLS
ncbi:MAG TPA: TRAP transporter substrate-binding protein [Hyphomicrobiaceae bacterium]|jgi:tripartite ATP-independent transporter DctP family solute receptor|nr:TRAP transporter substrate-binding protein [Hyphomicrobiaceae bacterium]